MSDFFLIRIDFLFFDLDFIEFDRLVCVRSCLDKVIFWIKFSDQLSERYLQME